MNKYIKQLLIISTLLFSSFTSFSEMLEVRIIPPQAYAEMIDLYCIEYRELDANHFPVGDWQCIGIHPYQLEASFGYTPYFLTGLNVDTFYEIRVHARFQMGNDLLWGLYGFSTIVYISLDFVNSVYVDCGRFNLSARENHEDVDGVYLGWAVLDRLFYRPEEEWRLSDIT